jgi:hypothetical protein
MMRRNRIASRLAVFQLDTEIAPPEQKGHKYQYKFHTSDGSEYDVEFNHLEEGRYWVEFTFWSERDKETGWGSQNMVGGKQSFEVMNNVLSIIKGFMHEHPETPEVVFSASLSEESRVSVYERLIQRFGLDYRKREGIANSMMFFVANPYYQESDKVALFQEPSQELNMKQGVSNVEYDFTTSDGTPYHFMAGPLQMDQTEWRALFYAKDPTIQYDIIGNKQAFEVMNNVFHIIQEIFKTFQDSLKHLTFSSSDSSRTSLYRKMLDRFNIQYAVDFDTNIDRAEFTVLNPLYKEPPSETESDSE